MGTNTAENTTLRLKAVLDVLAEGVQSGEKLNAGSVLGAAMSRVPLTEQERELLSGGIPRGHKALTTATAKLVKAGWLIKGRPGWSITEDGQRATVAFAEPAAFAAALDAGTPVPADTPLPAAPKVRADAAPAPTPERDTKAGAGAPRKAGRRKAAATASAPSQDAPAVEPAAEAQAADASADPQSTEAQAAGAPADAQSERILQPGAVAVAGDFNVLLGAPANWAPQYDESQMQLDAANEVWTLEADVPPGSYSFKIALNRSWDENYGAFGVLDGPNHEVHHHGGILVINYDHRTRDITFG